MHVFYTPDIQISNELPEEEAQHCTRVLRLGIGDEITLTDGKGYFYQGRNHGCNQQALPGSHQRNNISGTALAMPSAHCYGTNQKYGSQ